MRKLLIQGGGLATAAMLGAATLPSVLSNTGGLWEISLSATGVQAERSCVADVGALAQWEHRRGQCTRVVISSTDDEAIITYTCAGGGFGRSRVQIITPRTLRIDTQGINGRDPFSYVLHARRVGDCPSH